jgi:hypothetical protein
MAGQSDLPLLHRGVRFTTSVCSEYSLAVAVMVTVLVVPLPPLLLPLL